MNTLIQKYQYNIINKPIRTFAIQSCVYNRIKLKQQPRNRVMTNTE